MRCTIYFRFALVVFGAALTTNQLSAQTRFEWPSSQVDVTKYQYIEDCSGAMGRVGDSVRARSAVREDTIALRTQGFGTELPDPVIAIARRCLEKFSPTQVSTKETNLAQSLYLMAGRDADAAAVVEQRLRSISSTDTLLRLTMLDSAERIYMRAVPKRLVAAKQIVEDIRSAGDVYPFMKRLGLYFDLMAAGEATGDVEMMNYYGNSIFTLARGLSDEERNGPAAIVLPNLLWATIHIMYRQELMDSLRQSTVAFRTLLEARWKEAGRSSPDLTIGEPAPIITGDFWYPASASQQVYPRRGKVTAVYFVSQTLINSSRDDQEQAVIRRLSLQHPELELVFVAGTKGYFGPIEPPDTMKESRYIDTLYRTFHNFPAVLSVTNAPFVRIPAPDRRRVYQFTENVLRYKEVTSKTDPRVDVRGRLYIIDPEGLVVNVGGVGLDYERWLNEIVGVLMARSTHTSEQGGADVPQRSISPASPEQSTR